MQHVDAMLQLSPRPFGSDNLAKAADYICAEVTKIGLKPERQEQFNTKEKKIFAEYEKKLANLSQKFSV